MQLKRKTKLPTVIGVTFKGSQIEYYSIPGVCFCLCLCDILSGSTMFAKVPVYSFTVDNGLRVFTIEPRYMYFKHKN